jgi:hypothetical protein
MLQAELLQERLGPAVLLLLADAAQPLQRRLEVLADGELAEDRRLLRQVAQAHARAPVQR